MYLCKKEINPEEPCPSGLNSNERLCIVVNPYNRRNTTNLYVKYNKQKLFFHSSRKIK